MPLHDADSYKCKLMCEYMQDWAAIAQKCISRRANQRH